MKKSFLYFLGLVALVLISCEKEVQVDLPDSEASIVVEGIIEQGNYPQVIITKSIPYYSPINEQTLAAMFVNDASVRVVVMSDTIELFKICLSDIPDSLLGEVTDKLNLPPGFDNFCIYTSLDSRLLGKTNTSYELIVDVVDNHLTSITTIPEPIALDSLWFKDDSGLDSLGFIYAQLTDPAVSGNAYRWYAQRINSYTYGPDAGKQKDADFIAPFNSAFDDEFFNGLTFPFAYNRGRINGSEKPDDEDQERGYFKKGDTVVVKFTSIDQGVYQYYRTLYNSLGSSGSPFAAPANVKSNVKGGLGVWAGYGIVLDTLVIQ